MIKITKLTKAFSGQKVLDSIDLEIKKGEVVALVGASGAGKSTFLRSMNYLEEPDSGQIEIGDFKVDFQTITKEEILTLRRKLAMVFQQFNLFERRTALDNVKEGLKIVKKMSDIEATKIAKEELSKVDCPWASHLISRCLSFFIWGRGITIVSISQSIRIRITRGNTCKCLAQCLQHKCWLLSL